MFFLKYVPSLSDPPLAETVNVDPSAILRLQARLGS